MRQAKIEAFYEQAEQLEEDGQLAEAEKYYRKAAEAGYTPAALSLADMLDDQDRQDEAEHWYTMAARAGDPVAIINLGGLLSARGQEDDARKLWEVVANSTDLLAGTACYCLGRSYKEHGHLGDAQHWLAKGAAAGSEEARVELDALTAADMQRLFRRDT
ncbi:hypothetical protein ACGF07_26075 [Kitasatospora sp. NPDC048194]|uniref:hypothetical protein n=1 Tax=Kitasatospora sp. NPDC048194 TaxID=3364045 RepID=UPI0037247B2A